MTRTKRPNLITDQLFTIKEIYDTDFLNIDQEVKRILNLINSQNIGQILTAGDGDSYYAALAVEMGFDRFASLRYYPMPALKFLEYGVDYLHSKTTKDTLAIGISASGGSSRVIQAIQHAKQNFPDVITGALVGKKDSKLSEVAHHTISTELPDFGRSPGLRTYLGSLMGLYSLFLNICHIRGDLSSFEVENIKKNIQFIPKFIDEIIEKSFETVKSVSAYVKETNMMSFVGSGPSFATALFSGAKLVEAAGIFIAAQDLEEWGHIERFAYPLDFPVYIIAPQGNSYWRAVKLVQAAKLLGHSVIAVVDKNDKEIRKSADFLFEIPGNLEEFLSPLTYFIPGVLLAYQVATDLDRCLLQTDNKHVNSVRGFLSSQTKI